jgi:hypothetical protein
MVLLSANCTKNKVIGDKRENDLSTCKKKVWERRFTLKYIHNTVDQQWSFYLRIAQKIRLLETKEKMTWVCVKNKVWERRFTT